MCFLCVWCYRVAFYFFRLPDHVTTFSLRWTWSRVDLLNFETVARAAESWRELRGRGVVCGIVARAGWRNARRGVVARAVGSWRELWDRGAIWLSWRELRSRGVSCGFVARAAWSIDCGGSNTLKSTHSMQNSKRCCVLG